MRTAWKGLLLGAGGVFLSTTLLCGGLLWWNAAELSAAYQGITAAFEDPDAANISDADTLVAWLRERPEHVGLYVATVDAQGAVVPGSEVVHRADAPMPLASTMKLQVLLAYGLAVHDGVLDPQEPVPWDDWEAWYLPGSDGGAHAAARAALGEGVPTLDDVADMMIRKSDNAATDYLVARLGPERVAAAAALAGLEHNDPVPGVLAAFLAVGSSDAPLTPDKVQALCGRSRAALHEQGAALARRFVSDPTFREQERAAWTQGASGGLDTQRAALACVMPRASARDYGRLMGLFLGDALPDGAREVVQRHADWPMDFEGNQERFEQFLTKGGSVPGVLTEASGIVPKDGPFAGQGRVVVLFQDDMSHTAWLMLNSNFVHQDLERQLALEPGRAQLVVDALSGAAPIEAGEAP